MKQIIFIIGSLRKKSFNRQLAKIAEEMLNDRFEISYLNFEDIPYMNQDIEALIVKVQQSLAGNIGSVSMSDKHFAENGELEIGCYRSVDFIQQPISIYRSINSIRQQIQHCDGIWIFTPEYNRSYPGLLKNLFDWLSRPMDASNFANPTAVQGKKVTISGAGGKNKTISCREKLVELLEYIKMDVMKEPQVGIELGMEAWVKGEFHLTEEQIAQLKKQAEMFAEFIAS